MIDPQKQKTFSSDQDGSCPVDPPPFCAPNSGGQKGAGSGASSVHDKPQPDHDQQQADPNDDSDLPDIESVRERVLDALALIRSAPVLSSVFPDLSTEKTAFDLCRMWFDLIYKPGHRYMEGFKGDRDESEALDFESAFTADEFEYLERFNRFLELRVDRLDSEEWAEGRFPDSDTWHAIIQDADNLLALIDGDRRKVLRLEGVEKKLRGRLGAGSIAGILNA